MNEAQFEQFIAEAVEALQRKNAALQDEHGLGSYARWDFDRDAGVLTFSNSGQQTVLEATTKDIGTYSLKTKTWLWAWANESLSEAERAKAAPLTELYETTGMRIFRDPHLDCDEPLAWELAAVSVQHLGSLGCYRAPAEHLWIFMSIDEVEKVRRDK